MKIRQAIDSQTTPATVAAVNRAIAAAGGAERLTRGKDYYYFRDGNAFKWPASAVYVSRVDALTIGEWLREWAALRGKA